MEASFPNFDKKWPQVKNQLANFDYTNKEESIAYVITDNVDKGALFDAEMSSAVKKVQRAWWSRDVYVTRQDNTQVTFGKTSEYRLLGVLGWGEKNLVVLANTKANNGSGTLRFTTLENPDEAQEINLPKDYRIATEKKLAENLKKVTKCLVKLEGEALLRLIVEHKEEGTRHHMVLVAKDKGNLFAEKVFLKGLLTPVLYDLRSLKPDRVLNYVGFVAVGAIIVGFFALRQR